MIVRELINKIGFRVDEAGLRRAEQRVKAVARNMESVGKRFSLAVTLPILGLGAGLLKTASDVEQLEVAFTTMLGSGEKAQNMIRDLYDFAAKTPFQIEDIGQVAKQLLAVGIESEDVVDTLRSLGDVAAGLSVPIERLVLNYGQVKSQAKLTGRELRDFAIAGVPLTAELAKMLGVSEAAIADLVSRGRIGFPQVRQAFKNMSGEGGRFANLMTKQAKTLGGLWSNFKDVLYITASRMGTILVKATNLKRHFDRLIASLGKFVKWFEALAPWQQKVIFGFLGLAAAIGPLLLAGASLIKMFFFIKGAAFAIIPLLKGIGIAVGATTLEFWLIAAAVLAAIAAIVLFIQDLYVWTQGGDSLIGDMLGSFEDFKTRFAEVFESVKAIYMDIWEGLKTYFVGIWDFIVGLFSGDSDRAVEGMKAIFWGFLQFMKGLFGLLGGIIVKLFTVVLPTALKAGWRAIKEGIPFLGKIFGNVTGVVGDIAKRGWQKLNKIDLPFLEPISEEDFQRTWGIAGPGIGGPGTLARTGAGAVNQVNVKSDIKMEIPAGTPESQRQFIEQDVRRVFEEENQKMIRGVQTNNQAVEE